MTDDLYTGEFFKISKTGEIGEQIACPCDDPIILEFKDGERDAYHLRDVEPSTQPVTDALFTRNGKRIGNTGRPQRLEQVSIEKMLQIYEFLETQSEPVYRAAIEKTLGFNCTRPLMIQLSQPKRVTLESLGIAERLPRERTWVAWRLTEWGRAEGEAIIKELGR